jgi:ATP-dependent exoDNAse (exonuclease V) beta subunit
LTCKDRIVVNIDQGYEYYDLVLRITEELGVTDQILIKGKRPAKDVEGDGWEESVLESVKNSIKNLTDSGVNPSDITVLGYTNDDIERVAEYLEEMGIKTQKESSKTLNNDPDVAALIDFLEYMRALQSGQNGDIYRLNFLCRTKFLESDFDTLSTSLTNELKPSVVVYKIIEFFSFCNKVSISSFFNFRYIF